jgi:hypothetical protein
MLYLTKDTQVYLAIKPVDFRKQIDGLIAVCDQSLLMNARSGQLFVFINVARTMIRVLYYEDNGYWLATKRLSRGRYSLWPTSVSDKVHHVLSSQLTHILKTCVASKRKSL